MAPAKTQICISHHDFLRGCPMPDDSTNRRCRNLSKCTLKACTDAQAADKSSVLRDQLNKDFTTMDESQLQGLVHKLLQWRLCSKHQAFISTAVQTELQDMQERMGRFTPVARATEAVNMEPRTYMPEKVAVPQPTSHHLFKSQAAQDTPYPSRAAYHKLPSSIRARQDAQTYALAAAARAQSSRSPASMFLPRDELSASWEYATPELSEPTATTSTLRSQSSRYHAAPSRAVSPKTPAVAPHGFKVRTRSATREGSDKQVRHPEDRPCGTVPDHAPCQTQPELQLSAYDQLLARFEALTVENECLATRNAELEAQLRRSELASKRLEMRLWIHDSRRK